MSDRNDTLGNITGIVMVGILLAILGLVTYSVFKTPVVNKETIDALVKSANSTEQYVKELREIARNNAAETGKDNDLLKGSGDQRTDDYKGLYEKYGIITHGKVLASVTYHSDPNGFNRVRTKTYD